MREAIGAEIGVMGDVAVLSERRAQRLLRDSISRAPGVGGIDSSVAFYFDPCCPFSYLAAERVERPFSGVEWVPLAAAALQTDRPWSDPGVARVLRVRAERRAAELRLPLVWPERFPPEGTAALRVAVYAVRAGVGSVFALAACRLAFCGGFDLEDRLNLAEAAAAAGIEHDECLQAAGDPGNDVALESGARELMSLGVTQLPAFRVGHRWFAGEGSLAEASAWARAPLAAGHRA
jgi:2-hydroxychromene-2-carboxylate isomerase